MRKWWALVFLLASTVSALSQGPSTNPVSGFCDLGASKAQVSGLGSTNWQQGAIPGCTITVYLHGTTTLATLTADDSGTPLSNPFTAIVSPSPNAGFYIFWAPTNAGYDVVASGGTPPNNYPAPQTIKEIFLGGSGGSGGPCPSGNLYDIQIDDPLGTCGSDVGIGQIVPGTHTLYENILNANQQVDVSDATNSGLICQGHSTGSAVDSAYCTQPSPTFSNTANGYGLFPPDAAPTVVGQALRVTSLTSTPVTTQYGTIPFYPTAWASGAGVSLEYLYPLDYTNAPSPTTSTDLIRTLFPQGVSAALMGPPPGSAPGPFVYQSNICTGTGTTASCPFLGPSKPGHAYAVSVVGRDGTTVGSPTDTAGNTFTNINGPGFTPIVAYAANVVGASTGVPIDTISQTFDTTYTWLMVIEEIGDVPTSSPVETSANSVGGCSGTTLSFASVTTAATDLIVGFNYVTSAATSDVPIYSTTSPYYLDQQKSLNTGGLFPLLTIAALHGLIPAGTITPTATMSTCVGYTTTIAFKDGGDSTWNQPTFRYQTIADWVQQGLVPDPSAVTVGYTLGWTGNPNQPFQWQSSGGGLPSGTGVVRVDGGTGSAAELSGDATTSGSNAVTVVKVNGGSIPASKSFVGTNSSSQIVDASSTLCSSSVFGICKVDGTTITASGGVISAAGGGTTVNVNGSSVSNPNFNGSSPSPDANFIANAFKVSGSNVIVQTPYATGSAFGVVKPDGSSITISGGVISASGGVSLIASGTQALGTTAVSSASCNTVTATATGVSSTSRIAATPASDPNSVTGYTVSTSGSLYVNAYPDTNAVKFEICNPSSGSITPGALSMNWAAF